MYIHMCHDVSLERSAFLCVLHYIMLMQTIIKEHTCTVDKDEHHFGRDCDLHCSHSL